MFLFMVYGVGFSMLLGVFFLLRSLFGIYRSRLFTYGYWLCGGVASVCALAAINRLDNIFSSAMAIRFVVIWLLTLIALTVVLGLLWLGRSVKRMVSKQGGADDMTRRQLIKTAAVGIPGAVLSLNTYGAWSAAKKLELNEQTIVMKHLSAELSGYRVAQLSDVHLGLFFSLTKLEELLRTLAERRADVLVITGDLIDDVNLCSGMAALLDKYYDSFPQGIWFIWGNHEYFRDFAAIEQALQSTRVKILRNSSALLRQAAKPLYLLGVDYPWERDETAQAAECQAMLTKAKAGVPDNAARLLLTHHPAIIDNAFADDIDLTLAGHTHGGQLELFGVSLLPATYKYLRGLYEQNGCYAYVSSGAGSWFPVRIGCPAEVTLFTLQAVK